MPPPAALLLLFALCLAQWRTLDGTLSSVLLAAAAAVAGPLAELPIMYLGCWHYTAPDYFPLITDAWAGLNVITAPCYFAVTTDAIALGRWFSEPR